jgi:hypothetical protein
MWLKSLECCESVYLCVCVCMCVHVFVASVGIFLEQVLFFYLRDQNLSCFYGIGNFIFIVTNPSSYISLHKLSPVQKQQGTCLKDMSTPGIQDIFLPWWSSKDFYILQNILSFFCILWLIPHTIKNILVIH